MKMTKFLSVVVFVTSCCVLYVYQQSEIFRLAYLGSRRQVTYNELSDKNTALNYSIKKNSSLVKIGSRISDTGEFQMPDKYRFVKVVTYSDGIKPVSQNQGKVGLLAGIFGFKREAQARTINP